MNEVRLKVIAPAGGITVHFEPTGMQYELLTDDWFDVTIRGEGSGLVELMHQPDAIVIGAWPEAETVVIASDGSVLPI